MTDFSLFEGDPLSRIFLYFGIKAKGFSHLASRVFCVLMLTCFPTMFFAWWEGFGPSRPRPLNFFGDVAAFGQAFLGYPLFVLAEWHIGEKTRAAAHHFRHGGVLLDDGVHKLDAIHLKIERMRRSWIPETICLILGAIFSALWLYEETHNSFDTWHAIGAPGVQTPTLAGWWVALIGIPIFNFWWLRWLWKFEIWCWYLYKVSRLRLRLVATHPDLTGGLGFLSEAQASFAVAIFAFGIGIVAPLVGYKLEVEHNDLMSFAVGGPLLGFIIGAPILFTLPLMMFTKQLYRAKKRTMESYQDRAAAVALRFEEKWLGENSEKENSELFPSELSGMNNLHSVFEKIEHMRVVPFDMRSFSQLTGSTVGSLLPLVIKLANLPKPTVEFFEMIKPFLGGGGH